MPNNLRDVLNVTDRVKLAVRGMMAQNEQMLKKVQVSERDIQLYESKIRFLTSENKAKSAGFELLHQLIMMGS